MGIAKLRGFHGSFSRWESQGVRLRRREMMLKGILDQLSRRVKVQSLIEDQSAARSGLEERQPLRNKGLSYGPDRAADQLCDLLDRKWLPESHRVRAHLSDIYALEQDLSTMLCSLRTKGTTFLFCKAVIALQRVKTGAEGQLVIESSFRDPLLVRPMGGHWRLSRRETGGPQISG